MDYKSSGVDVKAGEEAVKNIKDVVKSTYTEDVLSELGSFGGLYRIDTKRWKQPILVSSTDGVGTKLRVAIMAGVFDTVGQDLVNHCVNDILVQGAIPQFFLDYIGVGKLDPKHISAVISGLVKACTENSCALIGGEMAEMPGIYNIGDFDLVGTIVGCVEEDHLLPAQRVCAGDTLVAFSSSGLHTNGYSLARKIVFEKLGMNIDSYVPECGKILSELLLSIHKSYLPILRPHLSDKGMHALAHITGGGIGGNLKRVIPEHLQALIKSDAWEIPNLFEWLVSAGKLTDDVAREAFNMGIGMIAVTDSKLAAILCEQRGAFVIGQIEEKRGDSEKVLFV